MKKGFFKENIIAFVIAIFLCFGFVFMINTFDVLKADIMNDNKTNEKIELNQNPDIKMEFLADNLGVIANKDIQNLTSISFIIIFDPSKVNIKKEDINGDDFSIASAGEGKLNVIIGSNSINVGKKLLSVKYSGDNSIINITDVIINFTDGNSENLSIGR